MSILDMDLPSLPAVLLSIPPSVISQNISSVLQKFHPCEISWRIASDQGIILNPNSVVIGLYLWNSLLLSCTPSLRNKKKNVLIQWNNDCIEESYATSWETTPFVLEVLPYNICYMSWKWKWSRLVVSDSLRSHGL